VGNHGSRIVAYAARIEDDVQFLVVVVVVSYNYSIPHMHAMLCRNLQSDALVDVFPVTVVVTGRDGAREVVFVDFAGANPISSARGDDATDQGVHHPCITSTIDGKMQM
jgi:hypothetical protein